MSVIAMFQQLGSSVSSFAGFLASSLSSSLGLELGFG
jgi:hypothetical protein